MLGLRPCETGDITKWVCNAPGDVEGCSIRGVPLLDIVKDTAECERLHRELRSFVGVHHMRPSGAFCSVANGAVKYVNFAPSGSQCAVTRLVNFCSNGPLCE